MTIYTLKLTRFACHENKTLPYDHCTTKTKINGNIMSTDLTVYYNKR